MNTIQEKCLTCEFCFLEKRTGDDRDTFYCDNEHPCKDSSLYELSSVIKHSEDHIREEARKDIIEKACNLYKEEVQQFKNMLNYFKTDSGDIIDLDRSVEIFKKKLMEN